MNTNSEKMQSNVSKIIDTVNNTWQAKIQFDKNGYATGVFGIQIYNNISVNGLALFSDQLVDKNGRTLQEAESLGQNDWINW